MTNYFRVTAHHPETDVCIIADSNGYFSKLWEFSAFLISKGFKVIAVGNIAIRACNMGKPEIVNGEITINGITYKPDKTA